MADREPIEGRVARVLSTRELVINRGTADGVEVGMLFDVLASNGEDIRDPDSGEVIGSVYRPKVPVKVSSVQEHLAVARTYRSTRVNVGGAGITAASQIGIAKLFEPPRWVEHYETFKTDDAAWQEIDESESFVKVGDRVVEVVGEAEEATTHALTTETDAAEAPDDDTSGKASAS